MENKEDEMKYWFCVIGPAKKSDIPEGGDYPIRQSTKKAYFRMFPDQEEYSCASGWGIDQDMKNVFGKLRSLKSLNLKKYEKLKEQILNTSYE